MNAPLFSIITPCLDRADYLPAALASVRRQDADCEHIVVDGGSTDGSLELLAASPGIRLIRGPDRGMYDALNKGLRAAQGRYVGFLNSDDEYAPGAFAAAHERLRDGACAVAGDAEFLRDGAVIWRWTPGESGLLALATIGDPAMNAWFFQRSTLARVGEFDAGYRIAGDREFVLRLALGNPRWEHVPRTFYRYRHHAGSMTIGNADARQQQRIAEEHLALTDRWLARADLPPRARELLRELRRRDTLNAAARSLHGRELGAFLRFAAAGTRHDAAWGLRLLGRAARAALGGP